MQNDYTEYYNVFNKLGYHTQKIGAKFFFSLLDEVRNSLNEGFTDDEMKDLIPRICVDEYSLYLEIGKRLYIEKINDFLLNRNTNKGQNLFQEIIGVNKGLSIEESALIFAKYFNAKEKEKENHI